ncbi:hypothetical protein [Janthinobacterium psychrotolerans]|uniref:SUKH-3 immunity protein n=1 Tax=Janthinobacterium psychrotolerans TaxID=1747903 RepID=A0A1A7C0E3_9BURK|nr:hypothetical protein [Janthinobacterium psychrotolerans]OBV39401.1 hypothetical protein ASR47_1009216 [Janthinobacterium psychrotolerans]
MLSTKLIDFFKQQGWWYDDASADYAAELERLGVEADSAFGQFCLHVEDGPTFIQRGKELYQVCWFAKNTNYALALKSCHETLGLPQEYLPLDSFEGGGGYFYHRTTGQVLALSLGRELHDFKEGRLTPQWPSFNDFLMHYFELPA